MPGKNFNNMNASANARSGGNTPVSSTTVAGPSSSDGGGGVDGSTSLDTSTGATEQQPGSSNNNNNKITSGSGGKSNDGDDDDDDVVIIDDNTPTPTTQQPSSAASPTPVASSGTQQQQQQQSSSLSQQQLSDQAVLEYLKSKGMGTAALELASLLEKSKDETLKNQDDTQPSTTTSSSDLKPDSTIASSSLSPTSAKTTRQQLEEEEVLSRNQRTLLAKSTGGNYGYDRDSAWPIVQWGVPEIKKKNDKKATATSGENNEDGTNTSTAMDVDEVVDEEEDETMGDAEARAYVNAFVSLQLWVLSLPDEDGIQSINDPIKRAHELLKTKTATKDGKSGTTGNEREIMQSIIKDIMVGSNLPAATGDARFHVPPSAKPELLAVSFALLVHTYCELLEHGMQTTAHSIRDAFKPIYEPFHPVQYRDLYQCVTTDDIMRLNSHNSQLAELLSALNYSLVQIASHQSQRDELKLQTTVSGDTIDARQKQSNIQEIERLDHLIVQLRKKHEQQSQRANAAMEKFYDIPFLQRARAARWQISLSTTTYGLLSSFLHSPVHEESLLCMCTLLQTRCEIHVEKRPPLPFVPACVFDEQGLGVSTGQANTAKPTDESIAAVDLNNHVTISWTSPAPQLLNESKDTKLSFPKFHLDEVYETEEDVAIDKEKVKFNRALLVNGFRRLEALERKHEYEALRSTKRGREDGMVKKAADPFHPSILMATLCSASSSPIQRKKQTKGMQRRSMDDISAIWEETGIGLCCAKLSPPDGRRVAVGCEDSAIRIWSALDCGIDQGDEPLQVLLGHKNGFPVFDLDWNRDGRTLLSAGGDGSIRLWDTMAVGPFGEVATIKKQKVEPVSSKNRMSDKNKKLKVPPPLSNKGPDMSVPGSRPENPPHTNGAALAVYRGHVTGSPVWSVSISPAGYYFASAGADGTARLWTTDRPEPVRLFTGHISSNVNCVEWHPNCNYIISGSDDKTARLWDIQTGRTVRLLNGCGAGINAVQISPGGRYATAADYNGVVHLWDLGTGKKITEFRAMKARTDRKNRNAGQRNSYSNAIVHCLKFSACGSVLATGGDDCCVRIWDVRAESLLDSSRIHAPTNVFPTKQTALLDFHYTRRNLLIAVGKFVAPVPLP